MVFQFLINILLTIVWVFLTGTLDFPNFTFGFVLSFLVLWIITPNTKNNKYFVGVPRIISFFFYFLYELVIANIQVAKAAVSPTLKMEPGIVNYPLDAKTDLEITFLSNIINLTPGTLSIDVSEDKKVMYIHVFDMKDKDKFIAEIKNGFEKRILDIVR